MACNPAERCILSGSQHLCVVGHHHTYTNVDGLDHQILLEADFLVNADESGYARAAIETARSQIFQTVSGIRLLDAMYPENVSGMAYN